MGARHVIYGVSGVIELGRLHLAARVIIPNHKPHLNICADVLECVEAMTGYEVDVDEVMKAIAEIAKEEE
jgi:hypothetical protein